MSDMLEGVNAYEAGTSSGASTGHATANKNSCVTCHHYLAESRMSGNLELGGHAFYLTAEVHGRPKDLVATCTGCHSAVKKPSAFTDFDSAAADHDGDGKSEGLLDEIDGMKKTLITYLGTGSNFLDPANQSRRGSSGDGALASVDNGMDVKAGEWYADWAFNSVVIKSQAQARALWNFRFFIEDKSGGIHNPTYAAQMLYDAIEALNTEDRAGLSLGTTRPE
jgi:hypothetical protein